MRPTEVEFDRINVCPASVGDIRRVVLSNKRTLSVSSSKSNMSA